MKRRKDEEVNGQGGPTTGIHQELQTHTQVKGVVMETSIKQGALLAIRSCDLNAIRLSEVSSTQQQGKQTHKTPEELHSAQSNAPQTDTCTPTSTQFYTATLHHTLNT